MSELTIRHRMSFVTRYEMEGLEVTTNITYNTDTYKPVILWDIYEVGERHIISSSIMSSNSASFKAALHIAFL